MLQKVLDLVDEYGHKWTKIGGELGEDPEKVRSTYRRHAGTHTPDDKKEKEQGEAADGEAVLELIERAIGKNLPSGELSRVKFWQSPFKDEATGELDSRLLYSTQFDISLKVEPEEIAEDTLQDMRDHAPSYELVFPDKKYGSMYEICVFDLHYGKYASAEETGGSNYDMDIAENIFHSAIDSLLSRVDSTDYILFGVGNDLFNSDVDNYTTKGTPQDNHGSHREHFRRVRQMCVNAIDKALSIAPVQVVMVSGNHDMNTIYYLGEVLDAWYSNTDYVEVDNAPTLRKYHRYGVNLIGFSHGNEEKDSSLPQIMANEAREDWGQSYFCEWHLGHAHKSGRTKYTPVATIDGVTIRRIASLSPPDWWHAKKGFTAGPFAAEGFLWNENGGIDDHYQYIHRGEREC